MSYDAVTRGGSRGGRGGDRGGRGGARGASRGGISLLLLLTQKVPEEDSELPEVETEAAEVVAVELPEAVTEVAEAVVVHPEEEPPEVELEAVPKSLSSRIDTPVSLSHVERRICSLPRILSRVSLPMASSE
jgi:hypothetical protein